MTSIGVTDRTGNYNRSTQIYDWKRCFESLVRARDARTIVRPGWVDDAPNQQLLALQGDTRPAGDGANTVLDEEPARVRDDLEGVGRLYPGR